MEPNLSNPEELRNTIELRLRTMRVLWFALCMSIVLYYVFTFFAEPREDVGPNNIIFLGLLSVAILTPIAAFIIKGQLLARAIEQRQLEMVQQAYIVGWAITEGAGLLGLVSFFLAYSHYYVVFFVFALLAQLTQFPRRGHLESAASGPSRF